jgi:capsular polysaccharide transport system permease protein
MTVATRPGTAPRGTLVRGLSVQANVIGALILRELHTRYGRDNIGYLWVIAEPVLLAAAVALLHSGEHLRYLGGLRPVPFALVGYGLFIMFRSIVSRSETVLEANRPLLYHRQVTLFDMLAARALLEGASTLTALVLLIGGAVLFGFSDLPARPLVLLGAMVLMLWFSFGLSMTVAAASHRSPAFGRLLHPALYLSMPLSGAFFVLAWLPQGFRGILQWVPLVQIFELARRGMFSAYHTPYVDIAYLLAWCLALTLLGMVALRAVRHEIQLT